MMKYLQRTQSAGHREASANCLRLFMEVNLAVLPWKIIKLHFALCWNSKRKAWQKSSELWIGIFKTPWHDYFQTYATMESKWDIRNPPQRARWMVSINSQLVSHRWMLAKAVGEKSGFSSTRKQVPWQNFNTTWIYICHESSPGLSPA